MPRDIASTLFDRLIDTFPPRQAYPPRAFERDPMPPPVAHFLAWRLEQQVERELQQRRAQRSPWFAADHTEVQQAEQQLARALARHAHIPPEAWEEVLHEAVGRVTAYLVRPVRTAVRFVFQDEDGALPAPHVVRRMTSFSAYPYLQEAVKAYVDQKQVDRLERTRFSALLARVDRQMTADYAPEEWLRLLNPLFELARAAYPDRRGVPAALLHEFFDEKGQEALSQQLASEQGLIDREALGRLLAGEPSAEEEAPAVPSPEPQPQQQPAPRAPQRPQPAPDDEDNAVPLWKQFQQGRASAPKAQTLAASPSDTNERPRWEQFRPDPEPRPEEASSGHMDLERLEQSVLGERGAGQRHRYIRQLFGGSEDDYEAVLRSLRRAGSWNEASKIIAQEVFRKHQVNIYSDPAVSFTNAVEAQFRS